MTPEGKIKRKVSDLLKQYQPDLYYHMPVVSGYGRPSLDYIGWFHGTAFAIETKAPGKKPTERQLQTAEEMQRAGANVFVIDGSEGLMKLQDWLQGVLARRAKLQKMIENSQKQRQLREQLDQVGGVR